MHTTEIDERMQTALLDNVPNCSAMVLKKHTREIVASNKFAQENGAIPGQTCFATCALRDDSCPFCLAPKLWESNEPQSIEIEYQGRWYDGRWAPLSTDLYVHYIFDITERKQAEQVLKESEKKYRHFFNTVTNGWAYHRVVTDENNKPVDYVFLEVNDAYEHLTGLARDEIIGKRVTEVLPGIEDDPADWIRHYGEVALSGNDISFENYAENLSRWYTVSATCPEPGYFIVVFNDITERKRSENALRESESRYRSLFNNNHSVMLLIDPETASIVDANPSACNYYGYDRETLTRMKISDINQLSEQQVFAEMESARKEKRNSFHFKHRLANGEIRDVEVYSGPILVNGNLLLYSIVHDVTQRRLVEEAMLESEEKYRALYNNAPLSYQSLDEDGCFLDVNPSWLRTLGYEREEVIGKRYADFLHPDYKPHFEKNFPAFKRRGYVKDVQFKIRHKNGDFRDISFEGCIGYRPDGSFRQTYCVFKDITRRKQAEEELRKSEAQLQSVFRVAPTGIGVIVDRVIQQVNKRMCEMTGYSKEELVGQKARMLYVCDDDYEYVGREKYRQISDHGTGKVETRWKCKAGHIIYVLLSSTPMNMSNLSKGVTFNALDITDRKQAEDALRESECKFRLLADHTYDWEYWTNPDGNYIYLSPSCERITGYSPDEFISNPNLLFDIVKPDYVEKVCQHYGDESNKETPLFTMEFIITAKNGEERWLEHNCSPVFDEQGNYAGRRGNNRDITERKQVKAKLRESEERFRKLSNLTVEGVLIHNKGVAIDVNESLVKMFGYTREELIGKNLIELLIPCEYHATIKENIVKSIARPYEVMARKKDGALIPIEIELRDTDGRNENYQATALRDITRRKLAEQEKEDLEAHLQQAYKMEAIGTMAGGIAHDFNNLLSIISGNIDIVQYKQKAGSNSEKNIEHIKNAAYRAEELIKQILAFSRQEKTELVPVNLSIPVDESLKLLRSTVPATVEIVSTVGSGAIFINADSTQLQQIILNLSSNAAHAMDEKGLLRINLEEVKLTAQGIPSATDLQAGKYAMLSISDTGTGMDKKTIDKIFDPFFTTKGVGVGTGMGLSVVHGIVEQHGGFITVDSTLGQGTTFNIYFPTVGEPGTEMKTDTAESLPTGTERILFVDDEECLADTCNELLECQGYKVTSTTSSIEALEIFKESPEKFDLVFTDQTMPKMSGTELAIELLKIRPDIPIVLCSGFSAKVSEHVAKGLGIREFCIKPMDMKQLAMVARKVLDEGN